MQKRPTNIYEFWDAEEERKSSKNPSPYSAHRANLNIQKQSFNRDSNAEYDREPIRDRKPPRDPRNFGRNRDWSYNRDPPRDRDRHLFSDREQPRDRETTKDRDRSYPFSNNTSRRWADVDEESISDTEDISPEVEYYYKQVLDCLQECKATSQIDESAPYVKLHTLKSLLAEETDADFLWQQVYNQLSKDSTIKIHRIDGSQVFEFKKNVIPKSVANKIRDRLNSEHERGFNSSQDIEKELRNKLEQLYTENAQMRQMNEQSIRFILEENYLINFDHFKINQNKVLGEGSFGKVYQGYYYKLPVAVKQLKTSKNAQVMNDFKNEMQTLIKLKHSHVVSCFGCSFSNESLLILLESMSTNLYNWISQQQQPINNKLILKLLIEISLGMHYLHSQVPKIIHRDLKSPNILLDNDLHVKISDFGLAKTKEHANTQTTTEIMGTVLWAVPEYLTFERIKERSERGDVFSFGVIIWELITRKIPWKSSDMTARDITQAVINGHRLEIPNECPKLLKDVIQRCWKNDPTSRPSFEIIINIIQPKKEEVAKLEDMEDSDLDVTILRKKLAQIRAQHKS